MFLEHADEVEASSHKLMRTQDYGYEFSGVTIFSVLRVHSKINFLVVPVLFVKTGLRFEGSDFTQDCSSS